MAFILTYSPSDSVWVMHDRKAIEVYVRIILVEEKVIGTNKMRVVTYYVSELLSNSFLQYSDKEVFPTKEHLLNSL